MKRWLGITLLMLCVAWGANSAGAEVFCTVNAGFDGYTAAIPFYEAPTDGSKLLGKLFPGVIASSTDAGSGYVCLTVGNLTGWVKEAFIHKEADDVPATKGFIYTAGNVRYQELREKPEATEAPAAYLGGNLQVQVLAVLPTDDWLLVSLPDGVTGYLPAKAVAATTETVRIVSETPDTRVHLRAAADTKSPSQGMYFSGVEGRRLFTGQEQKDWQRIAILKASGWVRREYLDPHPEQPPQWLPPVARVTGTVGDGLNLRESPSYEGKVKSRYPEGTMVEVLSIHSRWAHVRAQDGGHGYMLLAHLTGNLTQAEEPWFLLHEDTIMTTADGKTHELLEGDSLRLMTQRPWKAWSWQDGQTVLELPATLQVQWLGETGLVPTEALLTVWES